MWVNLCSHNVSIRDGKTVKTIPMSGLVARIASTEESMGVIDGVPVYKSTFKVIDLPEPIRGTKYIVSLIVAQQCKIMGRTEDIYIPCQTYKHPSTRQPVATWGIAKI